MKTFYNIYNYVLKMAKVDSTDTTALESIKLAINGRYSKIATEAKWRWLRFSRDIKIPIKYTTGTVSVVNDSRTVTGSGTVWTDYDTQKKITIGDQSVTYEIVSIDTTAQTLLLSERYTGITASSLSYTLFQDEFGLFPDLERPIEVYHSDLIEPMSAISPTEMSRLISSENLSQGKAQYYTIDGYCGYDGPPMGEMVMGYDFMGGDEINVYNMKIYPNVPDENYIIHINYVMKVSDLSADLDEPLIPEGNRIILAYGGLADFFLQQSNPVASGMYERKFDDELRKMKVDIMEVDNKPRFIVPNMWRRSLTRTPYYNSISGRWENI